MYLITLIFQVIQLKKAFYRLILARPKIRTIQEFQGQEDRVILLSMVRTSDALFEDQANPLGFIRSPKLINVALTRAQVAVIIFCDPHLLMTDPIWSQVIYQAISEKKYMGCPLP